MRKIASAALRIDGRIYVGRTHFEAMRRFLESPTDDVVDKASALLAAEDGFLTDTGEFLDRFESFKVAQASGQLSASEFSRPDRNMQFYSTDKPSLDSGLVAENYAPMLVDFAG